MIKETCNKCREEVTEDKKLDNKVWDCPNCGLEEYKSRYISKEEANKEEDRPKYYLNEEQTVFLILSEETAVVEGKGVIKKNYGIILKKN